MTSVQVFAEVARDVSHHAASGLSFLRPLLYQACLMKGVRDADVNLWADEPYAEGLPGFPSLQRAMQAMRERTQVLLATHGLQDSDVKAVILHFHFPPGHDEGYLVDVRAEVRSSDGLTHSASWSW